MKISAGILFFKRNPSLKVMLVHPGGPFWKNKDKGAWSIPKGEPGDVEDLLSVAIRETWEETGVHAEGNFIALDPVRQNPSKMVHAWALEMDVDTTQIVSNGFEMEWPPRSGKKIMIPEVDRAGWFDVETAKEKILPGQLPLIHQLLELLA